MILSTVNLRFELRQALRSLIREPVFTIIALLSLALGLGVNTAVFSVINGLLFRPLPYAHADRLIDIYEHHPTEVCEGCGVGTSWPMYIDIAAHAQTIDAVAAYRSTRVTLGTAEGADRVAAAFVTSSLFPMLGIEPIQGRAFTPDDERAGAPRVVLIGERLWRSRLGAGDVIGSGVRIDGESYTVIAVMPDALAFPAFAEMWLPLAPAAADDRAERTIGVVARRSAAATDEAVRSEMATRGELAAREFPVSNAGWSLHAMPLRQDLAGDYATSFMLMLAVVGFVLLVACLNLANLLLARATSRRQELAIRAALGATRSALVRHLLVESIAISLIAGGLGILTAMWLLDLFRAVIPADSLPAWVHYEPDLRVALFAIVLAVAAGILVGIIPGMQATRIGLNTTLSEDSRTSTAGRSGIAVRNALVVAQVAAAMVLVFGTGFFAREFLRINAYDPGYSREGLYTAGIVAGRDRAAPGQVAELDREIRNRVSAAIGTESVALSSFRILNWPGRPQVSVRADGRNDDVARAIHRVLSVSPSYFRTLGLPIVAGRDFTESDVDGAAAVGIVGEALARELWPDASPLGRRLHLGGPDDQWITIVGVVPSTLASPFARDTSRFLYLPLAQTTTGMAAGDQLALHMRVSDASLAPAARAAVAAVDRDLVVEHVRSDIDQHEQDALRPVRISTLAIGALGGFALILAAMGIYGMVAFTVSRRMPELAIRFALGASHGALVRLVLGNALALTTIGAAIGVVASVALGLILRSQMVGTRMPGPITFLILILLFTFLTLASAWIPARHAARADPLTQMKC